MPYSTQGSLELLTYPPEHRDIQIEVYSWLDFNVPSLYYSLYFTIFHSTLANFFTPPRYYLTVLDSSSSHHAKLCFTLLHSLFHFTWHYIIYIPCLLDSTWLYFILSSTSFYLILVKFILTRFYFILLDSPSCNHGSTSLYHGSTSLYYGYFTLLDTISLLWIYLTLLHSTMLFWYICIYPGSTSPYLTLLHSTIALLHSIWLCFNLSFLTLLAIGSEYY